MGRFVQSIERQSATSVVKRGRIVGLLRVVLDQLLQG